MATWQISYGGTTADAAAWGVNKPVRTTKTARAGVATFSLVPEALTSPVPFVYKQPLTILCNGVPWHNGPVTKVPRKGNGKMVTIDIEVSDPWWWLEQVVFQQQWYEVDSTGEAEGLVPTTQSEVILSQSLDGVKMPSGYVMMEALIYCLYAVQGQPFPTTVTAQGLPPLPDPANGPLPFQIGTITPSIIVPYSQVRDKKCADIIRLMMKYSPSAVAWMDCSSTPPTVNICQRSGLAASGSRVISVCGNPLVTAFNPTPRTDLQVPVVVAKFQQSISKNGEAVSQTTVQQYPTTVPPTAPQGLVQTIDLVGSETTTISVPIVVIPRPVKATDPTAQKWFLYKEPWLKPSQAARAKGAVPYDWANIYCAFIETTLDPNDPLAATPPPQDPLPNLPSNELDCHTLISELVTGQVANWMYETDGVIAAKVQIEVWMAYDLAQGSDPATMGLFTYDPTNPTVPTAPGHGYLQKYYTTKVTNAETQTYTELTSFSAGEPVPQGFAEYLYNELSPLHFSGTMELTEPECSGQLPLGCVFNTSDGLAEWQAMNALVLSVKEDIQLGKTTVQFGPPLILDADDLAGLFRAQLGRLPAWKLQQRLNGKTTAGANVQQSHHSADTNATQPPTNGGVVPQFYGSDGSAGGAVGVLQLTAGTIRDLINPGPGNVWSPASLKVNLNPNATRGYLHAAINSTTGFITALTLEADTGAGMPANTATDLYIPGPSVKVTITGGKAKVAVTNDGTLDSQVYQLCGSPPVTDGTRYQYAPA